MPRQQYGSNILLKNEAAAALGGLRVFGGEGLCGVLGGPEPERRARLRHGEEWLAVAKII